jgi:hypothetical protein
MEDRTEESETVRTEISPIDKMSMELFMNNHHYSKYLSKTDPQKYEEFTHYRKTLTKYHGRIMGITQQLLDNPNKPLNRDIEETFHYFAKSCIKYLENQELCTKDSYSDENDEDETMFDEKYMVDPGTTAHENFPKSFWGKQVHKVVPVDQPDKHGKSETTNLSRDFVAFSGKRVVHRK